MWPTKYLIFLLFTFEALAWLAMKGDFEDLDYTFSENYVDLNMTLSNNGSLNVYVKLLKDVDLVSEFTIRFSAVGLKSEIEFMNRTFEVCKLLQNARYEPFTQIIYKLILDNGHFPTRCPIKKNNFFYLSDFQIKKIPPVVPNSKLIITLKFFNQEKPNLRLLVAIKFIAKLVNG